MFDPFEKATYSGLWEASARGSSSVSISVGVGIATSAFSAAAIERIG